MGGTDGLRARLWGARPAALALAVFAGCYFGATLGNFLQFPVIKTAILFLPYAILTAALVRSPRRQWWILLLASSLGNFLPHRSGAPTSFVLLAEVANYARALTAAIGIRRLGSRPDRLETLSAALRFVAFAVLLAPAVGASTGAGVVVFLGRSDDFWLAWRQWFFSNALTALTLLPVLLLVTVRRPDRFALVRMLPRLGEGALLAVGLGATSAWVFLRPAVDSSHLPAFLYAPLPFLLWAAVRFEILGTSAALLGVTLLAIFGATHGRGPFLDRSATQSLLQLQLFLGALSLPLLLLSALVRERGRLEAQEEVEVALREADRHKDEFLAMLGHELRNPLAAISMALEVMRSMPARAAHARKLIEGQVAHVIRLVDDLLDVSRIRHGKIQLQVEDLDLVDVVRRAAETIQPFMLSRGHELALSLPDAPAWVRGDAVRLAQVVVNILNNAAKYTDRGGRIELSMGREAHCIVVSVRDHGIGIESDMLSRIFEPYTQAAKPLNASGGGLGIGLTLVKQIVELHDGGVEARSDGLGRGSEFLVRLPASAGAPAVESAATESSLVDESTSLQILIVDDNVDAADSLAFLLRMWGHVARVEYDGAAGLVAAEAFRPDVILLDIALPEVDGIEVARRLRSGSHPCPALLVAMTGFNPEDENGPISQGGFAHHLVKPIDVTKLRSLLADHARQNRASAESR